MRFVFLVGLLCGLAHSWCEYGVLMRTRLLKPSMDGGIYQAIYDFAGVQKTFVVHGQPKSSIRYDLENFQVCR